MNASGQDNIGEVRETEGKEFMEKIEEFAKKIIELAADEGLTVCEFHRSADMAKAIADHSIIDRESVERPDYPSRHIVEVLPTIGDSKGQYGCNYTDRPDVK